jgi:thiamine biosynthesis protein ThiC
MQFDRADQAGAALEELEERRFELEKKAWERGTQMIIDGKTEHMELMDYLETIIDLLGGDRKKLMESDSVRSAGVFYM